MQRNSIFFNWQATGGKILQNFCMKWLVIVCCVPPHTLHCFKQPKEQNGAPRRPRCGPESHYFASFAFNSEFLVLVDGFLLQNHYISSVHILCKILGTLQGLEKARWA